MWESYLFCLEGVEIVFDRRRYYFFFLVGGDTMFLVSHCLLIYIYELLMIYVNMSLLCVM